jgi:hypothetical protein
MSTLVTPRAAGRSWRASDTLAVAVLVLIAILAGLRPVGGAALTFIPFLIAPAAVGLPSLIPPLRLTPLGLTTTTEWLVDLVAVAVMVAVAVIWLRAGRSRHGEHGRLRAFARGLGVTILAVVAGNLVRSVYLSFIVHASWRAYVTQVLAGVVWSVVLGALVGLVVGLVAAAVNQRRTSSGTP